MEGEAVVGQVQWKCWGLHFLQRGVGWGQRADADGHADDALAFDQCRIGENLFSDDVDPDRGRFLQPEPTV